MEAIVSIEESDEEIAENMFFHLQNLELKDLPNLTQFCSSGSYTKMTNPSCERLQLQNSSKQDKFTFDRVNKSSTICEIEESDSKGKSDIVIQPILFDKKVEFPNLKKLSIEGLAKLTTIWNNQLSIESPKNLESIEMVSCESLKHIFPASMARGLQQLRTLIVKKCGVEEIIANEEGQQPTPKLFVFSKVTLAVFAGLPKLKSFYPGMHASCWPSLNTMGVLGCDKVQIFAEEVSRFQEQREANNLCNSIKPSMFLIEKDSFPNLERLVLDGLEIWNGPLPVQLFSKLKHLQVASPMSKSVVILDSLVHLRELRLGRMYKLMHLGEEEDNSQSARPNFPNLEILHLNGCFSSRNLLSSAIPFENLTYLHVSFCYGLKYLITYSMAKSLIHLTKLEIKGCRRLVEIVGNNEYEDDSGNYEITFRRLKHLKLSFLPRLRGFCLRGNCSVKFPSLKTLSISNRLKLLISHTIGVETLQTTDEEEDTDVDEGEAKMQSREDEINSASTDLIS